ncbi:hypothetical protein HL666_14480 [Bradyrhizobium sp. 83002]|uniref:hypothetical protein n=1 Tax=Bradyrhizobium aeschynomenes TaxID=2734909 RepID=UPI0015573A66|nr:hypothetical protein [Bradyrhizobium aeschynomenes]NPU11976.1 hypothetical protein [Bradyrhizobium aeschynomenes]
MTYPQSIEYNDAVQDPRSFTDPELKTGTVTTTPLGLPLALSGGFALTYTVHVGRKKFAVRCFHRAVPDAQDRYAKISTKLRSLSSNYFVNFDFQPNGIRIRGASYPIVKMDWAEGQTLGVCLDNVASNPITLNSLRHSFRTLATFLEANGIAHGDIQNDNVIVENSSLKLIDYDGMFVAGLPEGRGTEIGHKHFQHPARSTAHFGPKMDRFSFIAIDVSLEALQAAPALHKRFREGGNAIIFNANDFAAPASSDIFNILRGMPALRVSAERLAAICAAPVSNIPTLEDFRAGQNIPVAVIAPVVTRTTPAQSTFYIGAFPVLDAKDFAAVIKRVGDKVELVGQIVSVKEGIGKRGRGKGLPYVFINFGLWNKESVKITIWSEGLGNITTRPNDSWVGKWISVTGLIDPPYEGKHYGRSYRNVGIAVVSDNQIVQITERDAKFRLGRGQPAPRQPRTTTARSTNADILDQIQDGSRADNIAHVQPSPRPAPIASPRHTPHTPTTKNAQILQTLRTQTQATPPTPTSPSRPPYQYTPPPPPSIYPLSRIPVWVWIAVGIAFLKILTMIK